jgi:hypothetical protein
MLNIFKDKDKSNNDKYYSKIAALMIHAAKIDQNYTNEEEEIIKKTLIELGAENSDIVKLISNATII